MQPTRRYWGVAALAGFLAILAVLLDHPVLLVGAATIGAWLLAHQYRFLNDLRQTIASIDIDQTIPHNRVSIDESLPLTLAASLPIPSPIKLTIEAGLPVAARSVSREECTIELAAGEQEATTAATGTWPIAGAFTFDPPQVTAHDQAGLLQEQLTRGPTPSVTVEARAPRNIHVGAGGEQLPTAYGEHPAGRLGSGLDPAELREYVPGDAADRIDWKATARLAEPYVREFEAETDRRTALLVDHREPLATGPEGETELDYLRQAALAVTDSARQLDDPLGCYTVGDAGMTSRYPPETSPGQYTTIRTRLYDLTPTHRDSTHHDPARDHDTRTPSPARARRAAARLHDETAFAATLRPYFAESDPYVQRIRTDPLFETARQSLTQLRGALLTVIFTDDTARGELRETVKLARRGDDTVLVFLAPTVLYEPTGLTDVETAYERYVDFEEFRRDLDRFPRVSAFEVAPGDRLAAVLAAGRDRRTSQSNIEPRT